MHFHQVALVVQSFAAARGGLVIDGLSPEHPTGFLTVIPPTGHDKILIEQDNQELDSWYVRVSTSTTRRALYPPIYLPPVTTQEGLRKTLQQAWDLHRRRSMPSLSRFLEPPNPPARTPPRSASPARQQRGISPQSSPDRE